MITIKGTNYYTPREVAKKRLLNLRPSFWGNYHAILNEIREGNLRADGGVDARLISEDEIKKYGEAK